MNFSSGALRKVLGQGTFLTKGTKLNSFIKAKFKKGQGTCLGVPSSARHWILVVLSGLMKLENKSVITAT